MSAFYVMRPRLTSPRWSQVCTDGKPFHYQVALGNCTQWKIALFVDLSGAVCMGIEGLGFYSFTSWAHWRYVQEKFNDLLEPDARNLADLINAQFGYKDVKEQGWYRDKFCR